MAKYCRRNRNKLGVHTCHIKPTASANAQIYKSRTLLLHKKPTNFKIEKNIYNLKWVSRLISRRLCSTLSTVDVRGNVSVPVWYSTVLRSLSQHRFIFLNYGENICFISVILSNSTSQFKGGIKHFTVQYPCGLKDLINRFLLTLNKNLCQIWCE